MAPTQINTPLQKRQERVSGLEGFACRCLSPPAEGLSSALGWVLTDGSGKEGKIPVWGDFSLRQTVSDPGRASVLLWSVGHHPGSSQTCFWESGICRGLCTVHVASGSPGGTDCSCLNGDQWFPQCPEGDQCYRGARCCEVCTWHRAIGHWVSRR